jgi:hypothetical protein
MRNSRGDKTMKESHQWAQVRNLEEKIKLERKASTGTSAQLLSSTTQPPQDAQLQCLKDNLK